MHYLSFIICCIFVKSFEAIFMQIIDEFITRISENCNQWAFRSWKESNWAYFKADVLGTSFCQFSLWMYFLQSCLLAFCRFATSIKHQNLSVTNYVIIYFITSISMHWFDSINICINLFLKDVSISILWLQNCNWNILTIIKLNKSQLCLPCSHTFTINFVINFPSEHSQVFRIETHRKFSHSYNNLTAKAHRANKQTCDIMNNKYWYKIGNKLTLPHKKCAVLHILCIRGNERTTAQLFTFYVLRAIKYH